MPIKINSNYNNSIKERILNINFANNNLKLFKYYYFKLGLLMPLKYI